MRGLKNLYNSFLDSGDLLVIYPEMTGNWEKDKEEFAKQMKPAAKAAIDDINNDD